MEFVMPILEGAWRYVLTLRVSDYLDIALMAYAIYWLLKLVGTSKVESVDAGRYYFPDADGKDFRSFKKAF